MHYKSVFIKTDVYTIQGTESLGSQVYYGKPSITSPRPHNNLTIALTIVTGGISEGPMSSLAPVNSTASVVNFAVTLKYIKQGEYLLGCGREWNSGGRDVSSMPLRIFRFDTNGSRCLKEYKELGCSNLFALFLDFLVISAVPSYIAHP